MLALVALLPSLAVAVDSQRMRATGYAAVQAGDLAGARTRALDAALRAAVETAAVRAFGGARVSADSKTFQSRVLDQAQDYVNGYQVVDEGVEGSDASMRYRVVLEAEVALGWIEEVVAPPKPVPAPAAPVSPRSPRGEDDSTRGEWIGSAVPPPIRSDPGIELVLGGELTGPRYRRVVEFLERDVPGVRTVAPAELGPGRLVLSVQGSVSPEDLGGYLAAADLSGFRLRLSAAPRTTPYEPERLLVRIEGRSDGWR